MTAVSDMVLTEINERAEHVARHELPKTTCNKHRKLITVTLLTCLSQCKVLQTLVLLKVAQLMQ